jgi:phosphoketolase
MTIRCSSKQGARQVAEGVQSHSVAAARHQRRQSYKAASTSEHPHGLSDHDFDALFTADKPIIFAFQATRG